MALQTSQQWWKSQKGIHVVITNILMTLESVSTPELFSQIHEDLVKGKTCGTVFQFHDKSIAIKLPKHDKSCYATDKRRWHWLMQLLVVSDCIHKLFAA